jgi:hypothetical protein
VTEPPPVLELEVFLGSDGIIRINVDGVCALRFKIDPNFRLVVSDTVSHAQVPFPNERLQ